MKTEQLIPVKIFCESHHIDMSFIHSLSDSGLIEVTFVQEESYIDAEQLEPLERAIRMYSELDINVEGIETVSHLLQRIHSMQREIVELKNRLRFYEDF